MKSKDSSAVDDGESRRERAREDKVRHSLPLLRGESVVLVARPSLMATWPKILVTLGAYGLWRRRQTTILTTRRVLINKGVIMHSERAIPIDRIADAQFQRKGLYAYTDLIIRDSRRIERIGPLRPRHARRLASEVLSYG
jgi:hypothetical protein